MADRVRNAMIKYAGRFGANNRHHEALHHYIGHCTGKVSCCWPTLCATRGMCLRDGAVIGNAE